MAYSLQRIECVEVDGVNNNDRKVGWPIYSKEIAIKRAD